jgi:nucleotide-binding universal stress UspA family protein
LSQAPAAHIRRILIAFDASPASLAALHTATQLAAYIDALLTGFFVEDVKLLRLAESPYAREILYPTAANVPLTRERMESALRAQSQYARETLIGIAERAQVGWSFHTLRGHVAQELLVAARESDLLVLGKTGWSLKQGNRIGSTVREIAAGSVPVLLLPASGFVSGARVAIYCDGSRETEEALRTALQLIGKEIKHITVIVPAGSLEEQAQWNDRINPLAESAGVQVTYRRLGAEDRAGLVNVLNRERSTLFVLGSRTPSQTDVPLESVLAAIEIPVLLLGNPRDSR